MVNIPEHNHLNIGAIISPRMDQADFTKRQANTSHSRPDQESAYPSRRPKVSWDTQGQSADKDKQVVRVFL